MADKHVTAPAVAMLDSAVVRGDTLFHNICWTCHGMTHGG